LVVAVHDSFCGQRPLTRGHPPPTMNIHYPSISQFQQVVEFKDYQSPTNEYVRIRDGQGNVDKGMISAFLCIHSPVNRTLFVQIPHTVWSMNWVADVRAVGRDESARNRSRPRQQSIQSISVLSVASCSKRLRATANERQCTRMRCEHPDSRLFAFIRGFRPNNHAALTFAERPGSATRAKDPRDAKEPESRGSLQPAKF